MVLIKYFSWKNIYWINVNDDIESTTTNNQERREEIESYAKKILWEGRIIKSWINDEDLEKINATINWKLKEIIKFLKLKVWEKSYWNAEEYIIKINNKITIIKFKRFKEQFFSSLSKKWFIIWANTSHILWWEYNNRCVHSYWEILKLYWINKNQIQVDASISLDKYE